MIGASTSRGTVAIEFVHKEFKVLRIKNEGEGKKRTIKPGEKVIYRVTHCNLYQFLDGQEEGKFLGGAVERWPFPNCSKDRARKIALKAALENAKFEKDDRLKLWVGYLTRGTQPELIPSSNNGSGEVGTEIPVLTPATAPAIPQSAEAWHVPAPKYVMSPDGDYHGHGWGV